MTTLGRSPEEGREGRPSRTAASTASRRTHSSRRAPASRNRRGSVISIRRRPLVRLSIIFPRLDRRYDRSCSPFGCVSVPISLSRLSTFAASWVVSLNQTSPARRGSSARGPSFARASAGRDRLPIGTALRYVVVITCRIGAVIPILGGINLAVVVVAVVRILTPLRIWIGSPSQPGTRHQPSRPLRQPSNREQLCRLPKPRGRPAKPPRHQPSAWPRSGWQRAAVNSTAAAMLPRALPVPGQPPFSFACCIDHSLCVAPVAYPSFQTVLGNFARTGEASRRSSVPDAIRVPGPGRWTPG
jgi:hypothetical protein